MFPSKVMRERKTHQREEGEHQADELVHEFDVEEDFAGDCVVSLPDLAEVQQ